MYTQSHLWKRSSRTLPVFFQGSPEGYRWLCPFFFYILQSVISPLLSRLHPEPTSVFTWKCLIRQIIVDFLQYVNIYCDPNWNSSAFSQFLTQIYDWSSRLAANHLTLWPRLVTLVASKHQSLLAFISLSNCVISWLCLTDQTIKKVLYI